MDDYHLIAVVSNQTRPNVGLNLWVERESHPWGEWEPQAKRLSFWLTSNMFKSIEMHCLSQTKQGNSVIVQFENLKKFGMCYDLVTPSPNVIKK